jgi:DNA-binding winged helix-turn-helix (wHTH) protein
MARGLPVQRFGPFALDPASGRLSRGDAPIPLSSPLTAMLVQLVDHAGDVVSKEALIEAGWGKAAITDNALDQAIFRLRRTLDGTAAGDSYIETVPHRGYRLTAAIDVTHRPIAEGEVDLHLAPFLALLHGRTELETLDRDAVRRARDQFDAAVQQEPHNAAAHVDLAMACALVFEGSTVELTPDTATLRAGIEHARTGCALMPNSAEAWSTLSFLLALNGDTDAAVAAGSKAMELDPEDWHHALRAAYVSWGERRLRAARSVLALCPGLALAHWLRTTVFIARGAFDAAFAEVQLGWAAQDAQTGGFAFAAVGLHLLHGHLLAARGQLDEAAAAFKRELAGVDKSSQVYSRECAANTWYALAAVHRRQRQHDAAKAALTRALTIAPGHVPAAASLRGQVLSSASPFDAAMGQAIIEARNGRHADAARIYHAAVRTAPPGSAGWLLPVEPTLDPGAHPDAWSEALALVRVRAT